MSDRPMTMSAPMERDVDVLLTKLDYLKRVRQARIDAQKKLAAAGVNYTPAQIERLLNGGTP